MPNSDLPSAPTFQLDGKRALVTGAGRGIGMAAASALAQFGAEVTLIARTTSEIDAVAAGLNAEGLKANAVTLDVTNQSNVAAFFKQRPAFDVLVNNAGTNRPKPIHEVSEDDFDTVFDLNVKSIFFVTQACVRSMMAEKRSGSLIHMGSQMGHVGGPNRSLYCGSKWALEGMNKAFALDLARYGIRSNTIAPTFIETPLTKPMFEDQAFLDSVLAKIKTGRLGQVTDLTGAIVFLASDASSLMTGTSLVIDGGWTAD